MKRFINGMDYIARLEALPLIESNGKLPSFLMDEIRVDVCGDIDYFQYQFYFDNKKYIEIISLGRLK